MRRGKNMWASVAARCESLAKRGLGQGVHGIIGG
jgi:hypothetical protein